MEAPGFVSWSHQNRSQWIRIPAAERESARMELRAPDPAANPYLAFALLINAGLEGIEQKLELPPRTDIDLTYSSAAAAAEAAGCRRLPGNLLEAVQVAQQSEFIKFMLPEQVMRQLFAIQCKADSYEPPPCRRWRRVVRYLAQRARRAQYLFTPRLRRGICMQARDNLSRGGDDHG
jgi:glutamine synthetase